MFWVLRLSRRSVLSSVSFFFFARRVQLSQHHLLKGPSSPAVCSRLPLQRGVGRRAEAHLRALRSAPLARVPASTSSPCCSGGAALCRLMSGSVMPPALSCFLPAVAASGAGGPQRAGPRWRRAEKGARSGCRQCRTQTSPLWQQRWLPGVLPTQVDGFCSIFTYFFQSQ